MGDWDVSQLVVWRRSVAEPLAERSAVERTWTVDTTSAGGNASLLELEDHGDVKPDATVNSCRRPSRRAKAIMRSS